MRLIISSQSPDNPEEITVVVPEETVTDAGTITETTAVALTDAGTETLAEGFFGLSRSLDTLIVMGVIIIFLLMSICIFVMVRRSY